jgi:3,4-dihydroxy 2-butanone 4-phosphate synthase/GTP cyclohydrolase II
VRPDIGAAIAAVARGEMVLIVGGDGSHLAMAADHVAAEDVAFMGEVGRGPLSLVLSPERCAALRLGWSSPVAEDSARARTIASVDARSGLTTGASAVDRARTIRVAADPAHGPDEVEEGGHVNVSMAAPNGIMARAEAADAVVDLARLAGRCPAGLVCMVLTAAGAVASRTEAEHLASRHGIPIVEPADLIMHRWRFDTLIEPATEARLPTGFGEFRLIAFGPLAGEAPHLALVRGEIAGDEDVLLRVQRECQVGNALRSSRCDCRRRLESALEQIGRAERGVLLHIADEACDSGGTLPRSFRHLDDAGGSCRGAIGEADTPCTLEETGVVVQILNQLGVRSVRLLAGRRDEAGDLRRLGVDVVGSSSRQG